MKRKIVKQGHNAMTLTLPSVWIKNENISAGDEVDVDIRENELVIKKGSSEGIEKITFKINKTIIGHDDEDYYLPRHLPVLYRMGYDEIRIEFTDPLILNDIQKLVGVMPGFEIIDQGDDFCIIKNVATGMEKEFGNLLRKIFLNILYLGEQSLNLLKENKISKLENFEELENTNNRIPNLCERILRKDGYKDHKKTILIYVMISGLEQLGDYYTDIFQSLIQEDKKGRKIILNKETLKVYEQANSLFKTYYGLFYSFNSEKVAELKAECRNLMKIAEEKIEGKDKINCIILVNLCLIAERIFHMTESLI